MFSSRFALLPAAAVCFTLCALAPAVGCAQPTSRPAFTPYLPDAQTDSMLVVVELREESAIQYDYDIAVSRKSAAETREAASRFFQTRAVTKIKIKESEMDALKARSDQAKSERNDVQRNQYEAERKFADVEKKLLERREQLRRQEISFAKAEIDYHEAEIEAYHHELELARARMQRVDIDRDEPSQERLEAAWKLDQKVRDMEGKTLDAKGRAAHKQQDLAKQSVQIFDARKRVWQAQRQVISNSGNAR